MQILARTLFVLLNIWLLFAAMQTELPGGPIVTYAALLALEFLVILIHELGHARAALWYGCRVRAIGVMFAEYHFINREWYGLRRDQFGDVGGYVLYDFDDRDMTRRRAATIAAAGPAANLLTAALAGLILMLPPPSQQTHQGKQNLEPISLTTEPMASYPADTNMMPDVSKIDVKKDLEEKFGTSDVRKILNPDSKPSELFSELYSMFILLSVGLALINLIPFRGSDGEAIYRELLTP